MANPKALRWVFILLCLCGVAAVVVARTRTPQAAEPAFSSPATIETGTTPAQIAAAQKDRDDKRSLAAELFGADLFKVRDWQDLQEEPQWRKAVEVMANLDPKFIEDHLAFSLNLHYDEVMKHPEAFRGQFVRMMGVVGRSFAAKRLEKPIAGRVDTYRGQISDPEDDSPMMFFDVLDRPAEFDKGYDGMQLDAMFYRTVEYETKYGKIRRAPWLIGRTVVVHNSPRNSPDPGIGLAVMTAFLALLFAIVYLVRRGRGRNTTAGVPQAGFRGMFERRLLDDRRTGPQPPPGADE